MIPASRHWLEGPLACGARDGRMVVLTTKSILMKTHFTATPSKVLEACGLECKGIVGTTARGSLSLLLGLGLLDARWIMG